MLLQTHFSYPVKTIFFVLVFRLVPLTTDPSLTFKSKGRRPLSAPLCANIALVRYQTTLTLAANHQKTARKLFTWVKRAGLVRLNTADRQIIKLFDQPIENTAK